MKILLLASFTLLYAFTTQAKIIEIYDTQLQTKRNLQELLMETPSQAIFVLGEFHNTNEIQNAQAEIIQEKVKFEKAQNNFNLHWEFLEYTKQNVTEMFFEQFIQGQISSNEFVTQTAGAQNLHYTPIFDVLKSYGGKVRGINLPRVIKQKIIKEGIESVDPNYIPVNHYVGGADYQERFAAVMGTHVPPTALAKYFLAQCLTDSVMAEQVSLHLGKQPLNFLIAGSFHTDFYDATVVRLQKLINTEIITFKFISAKQNTAEEIAQFKQGENKYGPYADYIIITE